MFIKVIRLLVALYRLIGKQFRYYCYIVLFITLLMSVYYFKLQCHKNYIFLHKMSDVCALNDYFCADIVI